MTQNCRQYFYSEPFVQFTEAGHYRYSVFCFLLEIFTVRPPLRAHRHNVISLMGSWVMETARSCISVAERSVNAS